MILLLACASEPSADTASAEDAVRCPPSEPGGLEPGQPAQDVAFIDCTGEAVSLHGLCGRPALVVNWYGWCPSCETNAALGRRLADEHPDLAVAIVLDEDPLADPVDEEGHADQVGCDLVDAAGEEACG